MDISTFSYQIKLDTCKPTSKQMCEQCKGFSFNYTCTYSKCIVVICDIQCSVLMLGTN